jgi:hypothetical protein
MPGGIRYLRPLWMTVPPFATFRSSFVSWAGVSFGGLGVAACDAAGAASRPVRSSAPSSAR